MDIDGLFWGTLIFLALFVSWCLLWKAIEGRRNRTTLDVVAKKNPPKNPRQPEVPDPEISFDPEDLFGDQCNGQEQLTGMSLREQEEFLLTYGPREVRKAIRERQKAREQAQRKSGGTS